MAVNVTVFTAQVILPELLAVTDGMDPSEGTLSVAVVEQPVRVSVRVTVKVPHCRLSVGF